MGPRDAPTVQLESPAESGITAAGSDDEYRDPFRVAEAKAQRRRKLETIAMIVSACAVAVMVVVFYSVLSR